MAQRLRGGRARQAAPGRRLAFPPRAHLVAVGGQLRADDAADVRLVVRAPRGRTAPRARIYFIARQVTVLNTPSISAVRQASPRTPRHAWRRLEVGTLRACPRKSGLVATHLTTYESISSPGTPRA